MDVIGIVLLAGIAALYWLLYTSFTRYPYAYRNIAITSVIILLTAVFAGRFFIMPIEGRDGSLSLIWTAASFLWQFSRVLFIPLCFLCLFLCISNISLLRHEGFRMNNFLGFIFSAAYLTVINLLWFPLTSLPRMMSPMLIFTRLLLCYAECTVLAMCIIGYAVLFIKPRYDRDFVIILGCSISKKGKLRPLLKGRVNRAIHLAWEQEIGTGKPVRFVPSGGKGKDEPMSEGSAMELYLLSHSAEEYEVFAEKESANTRENLIFSKRIIDRVMAEEAEGKETKPESVVPKIAVVTTNYHVLRSGMLSNRAGIDRVVVVGSRTKWYFWPNAYFREMVAIFVMFPKVHVAMIAIFAAVTALIIGYR